ncbi:RHS repeat-associated core domain-containing protein [Streptomyces sp. NPDC006654]|uniref:RHS repeat domain-containing protein n=1 Tax=Streptomyces sp. NPDC006654 TaxID=3156897 RepID=UPI0033C0D05B
MAMASGKATRAGALPVWLSSDSRNGGQTKITVRVLPRRAARAAGVDGPLLSLTPAQASTGRLHVALDYRGFAQAFGGDWASRLHFVELPACALTSPQRAACRTRTPVASGIDTRSGRIMADVTSATPHAGPHASGLTAAAMTPFVLAATAGTGGGGGDFTATSLKPSGSWQAGGSGDGFQWSYPMATPGVPGGLTPKITLGYDSQSVDGLTSSTNNQASVVGDGFSLPASYVERSYQSCHQNPAGTTRTWDDCWSGDNQLTLSLNGSTTTIVKDDSTGTYRAQGDNDEKIQYLTGASNGAQNGEYFRVTTTDGTQYTFGLNHLPGYASGDTATNSVLTEPVYATASGQPCYNATFSSSWCQQGYRWMLDYVKDTHGDVMSYFYTDDTNYYARDLGSTANTPYTRDARLTKIQYGQRDGSVYSTSPAGQVAFTYNGRCKTASTGCAVSGLSSSTASNWPDVPYDLNCANGASCTSQSPSFWSEYELTGIQTQALVGTAETNVDSWALTYSFPATGDATTPSLWLSSIVHTGQDTSGGGSSGSLSTAPVTFSGTPLSNRVDLTDGYPPITRYRLNTITTETGEIISVGYSAPACGSSTPSDDSKNTSLCFPSYWTPSGLTAPIKDWFNKYIVTTVTQQDQTGGGVNDNTVTTYTPVGSPAWHHDDNPLTPSDQRTWNEWRGYPGMKVSTGTAPDPQTETDYTYFRGMDGDTLPGGTTRSVNVTDSRGDSVPDLNQYAGMTYETVLYNGWKSGKVVNDTITDPWSSAATATHALGGGLPDQKAYLTGSARTRVYTPLASGSTRETETDSTHDSHGRVTKADDKGDVSTASDDICTTTTYDDNTSAWILDTPEETDTVSTDCANTPSLPGDAVSDKRMYYDGSTTFGSAPTVGDPTTTQQVTSYSGATPTWSTMSALTVDQYGRTLTSTDPDQRTVHIAYTPTTGAAPTSVTTTDPLTHTVTETLDPLRGLELSQTDAAGYVTKAQYDALGRTTAVFKPGVSSASTKYTYDVEQNAPSVVSTQTLNDDGSYAVSESLYDSFLRLRETQTGTVDGGRTITDTVYNTDGWVAKTTNPYYSTGAPNGTLVQAQDGKIPSETGFAYDGAGRKTVATAYALGTETWHTTTVFGGNFTTTVPPAGGVAESKLTDARGNTTDLYQYHSGVPADPVNDPSSDYSDTHYTYNPDGSKSGETDPAGNTWSWHYNLLGDQTSASDPDAGTSYATYDNAGQVLTTTDSRSKTTSYTYDSAGRKTAAYDTTGGATASASNQIASWTYDTLKKGLPTSSTSYQMGTSSPSVTNTTLGYTSLGEVAASRITLGNLPTDEAALAPSGGYTTSYTYKTTGTPSTQQDAAAGGLPSETIATGYDQYGAPTSLASSGTTAWTYVNALGYDEFGHPLQYSMGPSTSWVDLTLKYDPQTDQPVDAKTTDSSSSTVVDDTSYSWSDNNVSKGAGLLASVTDAQNGGATTDTQCYAYDWAVRLTAAWTATDQCATSPAAGSSSMVGGPNPYWESWTYRADGERDTQTDHATDGNTANDTTTTYHYPGAGSATDQPHTLTSTTATGPGATANTASYSYDNAGDTTAVSGGALGDQTLTWNDQDKLATDTTSAGTTDYLYDADGNLVLRTAPGKATLYLDDEEIVENTGSHTLSGTRYYALGGTTVAERSSSGDIQYLIPDRQGTDSLAVDYQSQAVTRRQYLPFGKVRGTAPTSWPGDKGYVGGIADSGTGLEDLGAREYDAQTGRFVSLDPLLESSDPSQISGYDYSGNDPVTGSDPTGASWFSSLSNAVSNFAQTAGQVMQRTNWAQAALGVGELLLGAAADAGGTALMATGVGAPLGAALDYAGTGLAISGAATVIGAVAAPNIAYAVQNGDGGGGGGDSTSESASSAQDAGAEKLRKEHLGTKNRELLTEENSYKSLEGGPDGTTAEVNPEANGKNEQNEKNPDVKLLDRQGNVVGYREVKTIENPNKNAFMRQLSTATRQLRAKGKGINEIFFQVPKTSDAYRWLKAWQDQPERNLSNWRGYTVRIVDDTGEELGTYDLGDPGLHDLGRGGGGGGDDSGYDDAMHQGMLNKERAMEREGF